MNRCYLVFRKVLKPAILLISFGVLCMFYGNNISSPELRNNVYTPYINYNITNITRPIRTKTLYAVTLTRDYLLNNVSICTSAKNISLLLWVHSSVKNFERRENIRSTFALRSRYLPEEVRVLFLVGRSNNNTHLEQLISEHKSYGDVIQGDFIDSYHNLTHKAAMGLRWIYENCRNVQYVIKMDDDLVFDTRMFFEKMAPIVNKGTKTMWCTVCPHSMIYREGKWKVVASEYKGFKYWPFSYCAGFFVVITNDLLTSLYRAALVSPFFWVDDVYAFGILPSRIDGVSKRNFPNTVRLQSNFQAGQNCLAKQKSKCSYMIIGSKSNTEFKIIWKLIMDKYS